jgi:hypothetical protein
MSETLAPMPTGVDQHALAQHLLSQTRKQGIDDIIPVGNATSTANA